MAWRDSVKKGLLIFTTMSRNPAKFYLTILFFFAVACCSTINACPSHIPADNTEAVVFWAQQLPNAELERVHPPTVHGGQVAVQKSLVFHDLLSLAAFHQPAIAAESSFIKASSLLVKDYLSHIYPFHNFW